jgi:DNA primase
MRGRLVFPVHDRHGNPVGFAGRLIEGDGPKYLNTPETALYRKGQLLYAHYHARAGILEQGHAVVVEGYTDALAAHQAGITNTVAVGGTAITARHLVTLRRSTHHITLALDGDHAGAEAARRVHDLAGRGVPDLDIRVATLPEGRDPADLIAHGRHAARREALADATPLAIHLVDQHLDTRRLDNPEDKWHALRATTAIVLGITDPGLRAAATEHIAERLDWDPDCRREQPQLPPSPSPNHRPPCPRQPRARASALDRPAVHAWKEEIREHETVPGDHPDPVSRWRRRTDATADRGGGRRNPSHYTGRHLQPAPSR